MSEREVKHDCISKNESQIAITKQGFSVFSNSDANIINNDFKYKNGSYGV